MRGFKDYLAEALLLEANVANVEAIDAFVAAYMKKCELPQGKVWLKKKLRTFLLNSPEYLTRLDPKNISIKLPDFATAALEKGEEVFVFDPNGRVTEMKDSLQHVLDWFDAMHRTIEAGADSMNDVATNDFRMTQKEVEKLQKINLGQITAAADAWFNHMGTRLRGVKKEIAGVEIIHTWPDGYYVVRYTDPQVMRLDGRDLQNCLQHGNYWSQVRHGTNQVFGIRKPNDEAVVGIRTEKKEWRSSEIRAALAAGKSAEEAGTWELVECKGKANKPPIDAYIPYVVDFLRLMKNINIENNSDLKAAGVFYSNGNFGSFADVAELVYQNGRDNVYRTDDEFRANFRGETFRGNISDNEVASISPVETAAPVLILLNLPPTQTLMRTLANNNIYYQEGKYGTPQTIGKHIGDTSSHKLYETSGWVFAYNDEKDLALRIGTNGLVDGKSGGISSIDSIGKINTRTPDLIAILNLIGLAPLLNIETSNLFDRAICWNGAQYGRYDEVGTEEIALADQTAYRLGDRQMWLIAHNTGGEALIGTSQGTMRVLKNENSNEEIGASVRWLAAHHQPKVLERANDYGAISLPNGRGIIATKQTLFDHLDTMTSVMTHPVEGTLQYDPESTPAQVMLRILTGILFEDDHSRLSKDEVAKLTEAFRANPQAPLWAARTDVTELFDITVYKYRLHFPLALTTVFDALHLPVPKVAKAQMKTALKRAMALLSKYEHLDLETNLSDASVFEDLGLDAEWDAFKTAAKQHKAASKPHREDRLNNHDKYATDLSSRFAGLNAKRKIRGH